MERQEKFAMELSTYIDTSSIIIISIIRILFQLLQDKKGSSCAHAKNQNMTATFAKIARDATILSVPIK